MKKTFEKFNTEDKVIAIATTMHSEIMGIMNALDLNINDFNNVLSRYTYNEQISLLTIMLYKFLNEIKNITKEQLHEIFFYENKVMNFYTTVKSGFKNAIKEYGDKNADQILLKEIKYNEKGTYDEVDVSYISKMYLSIFDEEDKDVPTNIFIWIILKYIAIARIVFVLRNDAIKRYQ